MPSALAPTSSARRKRSPEARICRLTNQPIIGLPYASQRRSQCRCIGPSRGLRSMVRSAAIGKVKRTYPRTTPASAALAVAPQKSIRPIGMTSRAIVESAE